MPTTPAQQAELALDHRRQGIPKSKGDRAVPGVKVLLWLYWGAGRGRPDIFADESQNFFCISLRIGGYDNYLQIVICSKSVQKSTKQCDTMLM